MSKRVFLESPYLLCHLKVLKCLRAKLKGAEKKRTLQHHLLFGQPFLRTTPSPLLWHTLRGPSYQDRFPKEPGRMPMDQTRGHEHVVKPTSWLRLDLIHGWSFFCNKCWVCYSPSSFRSFYERSDPLQHSRSPRTPNLSKICPGDSFGGLEFVKICPKNVVCEMLTVFDKLQSPRLSLAGTLKNNRWDKFWKIWGPHCLA